VVLLVAGCGRGPANLPLPGGRTAALRDKLEKPVALERTLPSDMTLGKALAACGTRYDIEVRFDMAAFEAVGQPAVQDRPVGMTKAFGIRLGLLLQLLLDQVDATYRVEGGAVVVCPGSGKRPPPPAAGSIDERRLEDLRVKLEKVICLDKGIDPGTSLEDAMEFLGDRYDLNLTVHPKYQELLRAKIRLDPTEDKTLRVVLQALVDQVQAHLEIWPDAILIRPGKQVDALAP
jgi:hypothetical protein